MRIYRNLILPKTFECQIDIIELMGFLNNLCENNGYRVILIANEGEIARQENDIAKAINAQTALIDLYENQHVLQKGDKSTETGIHRVYTALPQNQKSTNSKINKSSLDSHREALFERNTLYERTREKLIGLTIRFNSRLEDVYDTVLMKTISDEKTKKFLENRKQLIVSCFEEHDHENLRTLISIFIAIEAVIDVIEVSPELTEEDRKSIDVDKIIQEEIDQLLDYLIYVPINRVNGIIPAKMAEGTRYGYISNGIFSKEKKHLRYAFVDEYWDTLVVDLDAAKMDFNNRINERISFALSIVHDKEHFNLALFRLKEWYYLSDEEVIADIKKMKQELEKKKYYPRDFKDIIYTLMCINNPDFGMKFGKETESSNNHIYDATDETTFPKNDKDDANWKKDDEIRTPEKNEYNKWDKENINEYVDLMLKYTEDEKFVMTSEMLRLISENYDIAKRYRSYIQPLLDWINKQELSKLEKTDEGYDVLDIDSEELYKFFSDRRDLYITNRRFLSLYGYEGIEEYIKNGSAKDLLNLADALSTVYHFGNLRDFFSEDFYTVNRVWSDLKSDRENDRKLFNNVKSRTREIALRRLEICFEKYRNQLRDPHEIIEKNKKAEMEQK